jgi:hypothetical protein
VVGGEGAGEGAVERCLSMTYKEIFARQRQKEKISAKEFLVQFLIRYLIIAIPIGFCVFYCVLEPLLPGRPIRLAKSMIRTDLPGGTTVLTIDDDPGLPFPGGASDGYTFIILQIPSEQTSEFANSLNESQSWKRLPLPVVFLVNESLLQPDITDDQENTIPLDSPNGYYLFIDHQEEYNQTHRDQTYDTKKPFYERASFNFTFALFDEKTGKLYIWSLDT